MSEALVAIEPSIWTRIWWRMRDLFRRRPPSNLISHAKRELEAAGLFKEDSDYGGMIGDAVMDMIGVFAKQGHSGFSASMAVSVFEKVARFQPLCPLTGEDGEWTAIDFGPDMAFQNKRCSSVFKRDDGQAYDSDGRVFREPSGCTYTSGDSQVDITFPYMPKSEIVDVPAPTPEGTE